MFRSGGRREVWVKVFVGVAQMYFFSAKSIIA